MILTRTELNGDWMCRYKNETLFHFQLFCNWFKLKSKNQLNNGYVELHFRKATASTHSRSFE